MTRGLGWPSPGEIDSLWRATVSKGAVGYGFGGLLDGWAASRFGNRRKVLIRIVEATPGIEPGYTVLQSRQGTFMGVD